MFEIATEILNLNFNVTNETTTTKEERERKGFQSSTNKIRSLTHCQRCWKFNAAVVVRKNFATIHLSTPWGRKVFLWTHVFLRSWIASNGEEDVFVILQFELRYASASEIANKLGLYSLKSASLGSIAFPTPIKTQNLDGNKTS